jgi:hypothetical protein
VLIHFLPLLSYLFSFFIYLAYYCSDLTNVDHKLKIMILDLRQHWVKDH